MHRKLSSTISLFVLAITVGVPLRDAAADEKPKGNWVIALSNGYYGNEWRHEMVQAFETTATQAKKDGRIKDYVILNADGTVNQQSTQLSDLILRHVDAIVVNANSETALNGVIAKACQQNIKVIAFDSVASEPCAWRLSVNFDQWGAEEAKALVDKLHGKGNVLIVRGVKGTAPDEHLYQGQMSVLAKYPDIKIIGTIYGGASGPVAQSAVAAVIPTVSRIDGVLGQGGGDDNGIAQAFQQAGGQYTAAMPVISGAGTSEFIHWWNDEHKAHGYSTVSINAPPSSGGVAFWYALAILNGANPPKAQSLPLITITDADIDQYLHLGPGQMVSPIQSEDEVLKDLVTGH